MSLQVKLFDLVMAFSNALDQIHPALAGHHRRVGFILDIVGERLHLPKSQRITLFLAGVLHDVGALPLSIGINDLIFERDRYRHARAGWLLLKGCPPLQHMAELVLYHHIHWDKACTRDLVVRGGCLINFADRIDVILRRNADFKSALANAKKSLKQRKQGTYAPHHIEALLDALGDKNNVEWLEKAQHKLPPHIAANYGDVVLGPKQIIQFCMLFAHVIDSFSPFTVTHSSGVASTSRVLGELVGIKEESEILFIAGMVHDIGKLGVPACLLEKPGPLTDEEFSTVKQHAVLSLNWLEAVPGFEQPGRWGALHHERLDGSGYPYGLKGDMVPLQSRIIAVADIFTALTEDRPYRKGMSLEAAVGILKDMSGKGQIDADLVRILEKHCKAINSIRQAAQDHARNMFEELHTACAADVAQGELP